MSAGYTWVQWTPHKRIYDACAVAGAVLYVASFIAISSLVWTGNDSISPPILLMRALGSCAIVLLHLILLIGPLARLWPRFLPILYNRRHLGVMTFLIALAHAIVALGFYHGFGVLNPLVSLLSINQNWLSLRAFPFQVPGLAALIILFLMAATSHDFWLKNLSASTWKRLHMLVYLAYALLIAHVSLGALQNDRGIAAPALMAAGLITITGLHLLAGLREIRRDALAATPAGDDWIDAGPAADIPDSRARIICPARGERIALFRHGSTISAVTNVCAHQGGPLGEGRIIDGCITCPWHGWQYRPEDGRSPPPFTERIATYQVRIIAGRVHVNTKALAPGTPVDPAVIPTPRSEGEVARV